MEPRPGAVTPRQTLRLIWLPMIATFAAVRLPLHLAGVRHVYPAGYLVHHLYTGVVILIPAAYVLAFDLRNRLVASLARVALGIGSGLVLDEVVFLVATRAGDEEYVSAVSLWGGVILLSLASMLIFALYRLKRDGESRGQRGGTPSA